MHDLVIAFYIFMMGAIAGQLGAHPRPPQVTERNWNLGILLASVFWPIFLLIGYVFLSKQQR
jgi:hypothetical protein